MSSHAHLTDEELADELLFAHRTFLLALDQHQRLNNEITRRTLQEARRKMEQTEGAMERVLAGALLQ